VLAAVDVGLLGANALGWVKAFGEPVWGGDAPRGGPFGGGGTGDPRPPGKGPWGGPVDGFCWPGNGEVMGATLGVVRRGGPLATMGTSFQLSMVLALDGGGTDGAAAFGGPPPYAFGLP
jgi:hypothetical protein